MRNLSKLTKPTILSDNEDQWLTGYLEDQANSTKKFRYRNRAIKEQLKSETGFKCIYCESKIGHNTPGDVEHKIPSSVNPNLHFDWGNLTIACTECNRRKSNYYETAQEFIDPYTDDVEAMLEHHGPVVLWKTGETRGEVSIRMLELNNHVRSELFARKLSTIEQLNNIIERFNSEHNVTLKELLKKQLIEMTKKSSEYSAMIISIIQMKGINLED